MPYGTEVWCTNGLQTGRLAKGKTALVQALFRRLITPRGTLRGGDEEANYGIDLAGYVGQVGDEVAALALPSVVRGELLKDERVTDVVATITASTASNLGVSYTLAVAVTPHDELESFTFNVAVSAASVELIGGTA
jgi:hypothetical protein